MELPVHGQPVPLLLGSGEADYHGGRTWLRKVAYLRASQRSREEHRKGPKIFPFNKDFPGAPVHQVPAAENLLQGLLLRGKSVKSMGTKEDTANQIQFHSVSEKQLTATHYIQQG